MKSILKSVITVSAFAMVSRVLAFFFKMFLSKYLGATNLGVYQVAISVFFVLAAVTCSGIPLTISKKTAEYHAQLSPTLATKKENQSVTASIVIGLIFSIAVSCVFLAFGPLLRPAFSSQQSMTVFMLMLPSLSFLGFSSTVRSAMWGRKLYTTTSILEIVEQVLRIFLCVVFILALSADKRLYITAWTFSVASIVASLISILYYTTKGGRLANPRGHFRPLLLSGVPITATKISNNVVAMMLSLSVPFLFVRQGMTLEQGLAMLGASVGMALPLLFVPNTFVGSLAYIMIPTLSQMSAQKDKELQNQINGAIKISAVISCVFIAAFYVMGPQAGLFLFGEAYAGEFLKCGAWLLVPIALESITSSMMNALGLETKGFVNYCIGSAVLFVIMFSFVNGFSLQVFSIAFGSSLTIATILDLIAIKKKTKIKYSFVFPMVVCVLLILPNIAFTQNIYSLLSGLQNGKLQIFLRLATTGLCSAGFFVTIIALLDFLGITTLFGRRAKKLAKRTKMV